MLVQNIDHLNLSVRNFAETAAWYRKVFGFEIVEHGTYRDRAWGVLRSNNAMLCIYEDPTRSAVDGDGLRERRLHGVNHFAMRIKDKVEWEGIVERNNIAVAYGGAYRWPHSTSWYISDPTGYDIEVVLWDDDRIAFAHAPSSESGLKR